MGVRIDVVKPDPDPKLRHGGKEVHEMGPYQPVLPETFPVMEVHPVGGGVLGDEEKLPRPRGRKPGRLRQHLPRIPGAEAPSKLGDDAKAAAVVAPLRNLEVGVMPRRQLDLRGNQVQEGVPPGRKHPLHRLQDPVHLPGPRDLQDLGVAGLDDLGPSPQAACDHHLPVFP